MPAIAKPQSDVLKRQKIDESGPGTILADFETLLDFVGTEGIQTGGKNYRIPLAALSTLDERVTHPLRPALERPQQLSYPHLNGLYLLLRASGLGVSSGQGNSGRLSVNPNRLADWNTLNAEERYFTLFQAMLAADWSLIESGGHRGNGVWQQLGWTINYCLNHKRTTSAGSPASELIGRWREQTVAALLELFGMLDLPRAAPEPGENWRLTGLRTTEFGAAFLDRLRDPELLMRLIDVTDRTAGKSEWVGDLFREFFPNCRKTFTEAEEDFVEGVWQFKVSHGKAWRRILIPADLNADDLIETILEAFEFDDDHLYALELRDRTGKNIEIAHPVVDDAEYFTDEFAIGCLPLDPGQTMKFVFDFGDNWQFTVKLEKILPPDSKVTKPAVVASHGEPPSQYGDDEDDDEEW